MKRLTITTLVIGIVAACAAAALHASKSIAGLEATVATLVANYAGATKVVSAALQYALMLVIALGAAAAARSSGSFRPEKGEMCQPVLPS